jgi:hypothetical protein
MQEQRVDPRLTTAEEHAEGVRQAQVLFNLNHTMPYTDEYNALVRELFGDNLGVPAVWFLVSIIFFGRLFGVLGVIISIPLAAIVNYIYQTRIVNRLRKRRENNELQRSILKAKESEKDQSSTP